MSVTFQTRPIVSWPGPMTPDDQRRRDRYAVQPSKTRNELMRELEHLGATDAFIQGAYREDQIRLDGLPRSGALPAHPGVIVTYTVGGQMYDVPCDAFESAEQNLRAVVLAMQRLRLIDETGVRTSGRQYQGFKRLPAGVSESEHVDEHNASAVLARYSGLGRQWIEESTAQAKQAYRLAVKKTHPDHGGDAKSFGRVVEAGKILACNGGAKA